MQLKQNNREHLRDAVQRGAMTADQANVEKVRIKRVQLVTSRLPAQVRKALNDAVKRGELAHLKKDGRKPEAFHHPNFGGAAKFERDAHERDILVALAGVVARPI